MHYYDIFPQIVPADTFQEIRIHPRFLHAAFPQGEPWLLEVRHSPVDGVMQDQILDAYVWASRDGVPVAWEFSENGDLLIRSFFAGEQEHNLQLLIKRSDNPDYFKNFSFKL